LYPDHAAAGRPTCEQILKPALDTLKPRYGLSQFHDQPVHAVDGITKVKLKIDPASIVQ
jgi:hypothetical protein